MFHKPFKVRSSTAIKGSDRKKLRQEVGRQFSAIPPEHLSAIIPNKADMTITKVYTHSGDGVFIYSLCGNPIFFENIDKKLFPTVYTLWTYPTLLPKFTTWISVFEKLSNGADLMLPGVVIQGDINPESLGNLRKGATCAINLHGNSTPVCVGVTHLSSTDMYGSGMRGRGVKVVHTYSDKIWEMGDKSEPPYVEDLSLSPQRPPCLNSNGIDPRSEVAHTAGVQPEIDSLDELQTSAVALDVNSVCADDAHALEDTRKDEALETQLLPEEMDGLLYDCFLASMKTNINVKTDLPLLTSRFYKAHLQPCCPVGKSLDVKKSSYKKLSRFLQEMENQGFVLLKELTKGVESIVDVNKAHPALRGYVAPGNMQGLSEPAQADPATAFIPADIVDMYSVPASMTAVFSLSGYRKGSHLTGQQVRQAMTEYIKANELQTENNKSLVIMDPILTDALLKKDEHHIGALRWDELFKRSQDKMNPCYQITLPEKAPVVKKGRLEPIKITIAQRGGNKKVTLMENLETYGIDPHNFAHECQIGLACSTAVNPLPGKDKSSQVLIQGNQVHYVGRVLQEKYQLKPHHIQGLDKAIKAKKR